MIESKSFGSKAFKVINAIILILLAFSCFLSVMVYVLRIYFFKSSR